MNTGNHNPYQDLFNNLVGTEVARQSFEAGLVTAVKNEQASGDKGYEGLLENSLEQVYEQFVPMEAEGIILDAKVQRQLAAVGLTFYARGLETIGDIYETQAQVPQQHDMVVASVNMMARGIFAAACSGSQRAASQNLMGLFIGHKPNSPKVAIMASIKRCLLIPVSPRVVSESLKVDYVEDGQLDISLRYKLMKSPGVQKYCPAASVEVENGPVKTPGLLQMMKSMGAVTVQQIYPTQFAITE